MNYFLVLALILFSYMSLWFIYSIMKKRNDVADMAWGVGFVLLAWSAYFVSGGSNNLALLVNVLVSLWGIRLAIHISRRNRGKSEDYRYLAWRKEWGRWFYLRSYLQVYLLQGLLLFVIALPVAVLNSSTSYVISWVQLVGIAVWLIGYIFETVGDYQLSQFIKDPANKGRLMQGGLWAYTRHPNYFGEVTLWWGIWLITISTTDSLFTIIGPITITFLILKVSGIPMLEKKMANNPEFKEYSRRVSVFIPMPPRKG